MKLGKTLFAVVGAVLLLGAAVSSASARELRASAESLRATWANFEFGGGFGTTRCNLTLEGTLHTLTIAKQAERLIGMITRAIIRPCAVGNATILNERLPWHVRYSSFAGTLPNITAIGTRLVGAAFSLIEPVFELSCLTTTTASSPGTVTFNRETTTGALVSAALGGTIPTSCGINGTVRGTSSSLTTVGSTTRITVTLI